jgi:hypothetical protein
MNVSTISAIIEGFGKAFLLPIDVLQDGYLLITKDRGYLIE